MAAADESELTVEQADALIGSRPYLVLLVIAAVVGFLASLVAWAFLEGIYQIQQGLFKHLWSSLGFNSMPIWWPLPILVLGGLIVAFAIERLPGKGGHSPAQGLGGGTLPYIDTPGVVLAGIATIGSGLVLGPEAPLIALGSGFALYLASLARKPMPDQALLIIGGTGSFAAVSMIFGSPIIAAVIILEATGLGGQKLRVMLLPGLLGAGIGSLVSTGMGSITGLSSSAYALGSLNLPKFLRPDWSDFAWSIGLAIIVTVATQLIIRGGKETEKLVAPKRFVWLPLVGFFVGMLALCFHWATGQSVFGVLFDGQSALPDLVGTGPHLAVWVLLLLVLFKGAAYMLSLGSFRGGPTFPALFLGAVAGVMASHLPGFALTPALGVGMGAATASVLGLPLSAVVLATLLCGGTGAGSEPLIIVGVVVAYVTVRLLPPALVGREPLVDVPEAPAEPPVARAAATAPAS